MKEFWRKYFSFNKRERNGILALLTILLLLIIIIQILPFFVTQPITDFSAIEKEFTANLISKKDSAKVGANNFGEQNEMEEVKNINSIISSSINPNVATEEQLKSIGLGAKIAKTIIKYRNKGGKFNNAQDLKKIYGMNDSVFRSIEPFIKFRDSSSIVPGEHSSTPVQKLELNSADSLSLLSLKGIGPSFAHRIVSYRKKLRGFYSVEQLKEVYGIDSALYNTIAANSTLDNTLFSKININTTQVADLQKHSYINRNLANLIVAYRNAHGNYKAVEDIKKLNLVTDDLYRKLAPYLIVN